MTMTADSSTQRKQGLEHFDVLIVGAGISGVGTAYHLQDQAPNKSFVVLEAYETFADKAEWLKMFHALANRGDLDTYYGPKLLTASNVYFDKFQKNYEPVWADEDE